MLMILLALVVFAGVLSLKQLGLAPKEEHNIRRDVAQIKIVEVVPVVVPVVETVVEPVVEPKPVRPVKPVKPALRIPQEKTQLVQPVKPDIHDIDVAVFVLSRRSAFETRQVIRQTWASGHKNVFFAVGKCCSIPPDDRKKYTCARSKSSSASSQTSWDAQCAAQDKKLANEQQRYSDIITMPEVDVYRHLPQKVKYCYKWGLKHTEAKWFVKTDDDSVVRIDTLGAYLEKTYNSNNPMVIGKIAKGWGVPRSGKWAETDYNPSKYPNFPLGSVGHVVSNSVATYIVDNSDKLFNYQGEDVSIGIWLNESPLKVKWVTSKRMTNHGNCKDTGMWVIGHNIKPAKMKACFAHKDETIEKKYVGVNLVGGLGNNLFMLASTIGIARKNNAIPCYTGTNKASGLVKLDIKKCPQTYAKQSEKGYAKYTPFKMKKSTTVGTYLQSYKYFKSPLFEIKQNMNSFGHNYVKKHSKKATNVGIHVRRRDHLKYGYLNFPDDRYFKNAMQYFTDKYGDVQFFVVSNDLPWCKKQSFFKATHLVSEKHTAAQDMAILASCDHVIVSIGTFGWWGGLLSGGEVVYNAEEFNMNHKINKGNVIKDDYYPTSWKPLLSSNPAGCTLSLPWTPQKRGEEIKRFRKDGWNGRKYYSKASNFRSNAVILDVGAFDGVDIKNFMQSKRSDVAIHTYEPVPTIFKRLQKNMKPFSNVHTYPFGVGGEKSDACFVQKGDATHSVSPDSPECQEKSEIRSIENVVSTFEKIDLLHINCEGCEYPILKKLLALKDQPVEAIEVQFHQAHVKPKQYCEIEKLLVATGYTMTYRYAFVWELWERPSRPPKTLQLPDMSNKQWDGCAAYDGGDITALLLSQLRDIVTIFNEQNINYALAYGSLIGALRDKSINPNEIDNDLLVNEDFVVTPEILQLFNQRGLHIFWEGIYRICYIGQTPKKRHDKGGPYRVYSDVYQQLPYLKLHWNTVNRKDMYKIPSYDTVNIRGLNLRIPDEKLSSKFLKRKYGNWLKSVSNKGKQKRQFINGWKSFTGTEWTNIPKHDLYKGFDCKFPPYMKLHMLNGYYLCAEGTKTSHSHLAVPSEAATSMIEDSQEELKFWDQFASENKIPYSLHAGSLLSFARAQIHNAREVIPWDDDVDLMVNKQFQPIIVKAFEEGDPVEAISKDWTTKKVRGIYILSRSHLAPDKSFWFKIKTKNEFYGKGLGGLDVVFVEEKNGNYMKLKGPNTNWKEPSQTGSMPNVPTFDNIIRRPFGSSSAYGFGLEFAEDWLIQTYGKNWKLPIFPDLQKFCVN